MSPTINFSKMDELEQMLSGGKDEMSRGYYERSATSRQYPFVCIQYSTFGQTKG